MIWAYIIEVHICWLVLFTFYAASLRNGVYFHANRWYLLTTLLLGLILPLIKFSQTQIGLNNLEFVYGLPIIEVGAQVTGISLKGRQFSEILWLIYWSGFAIFLYRFFKGISIIYNMVYFGNKKQERGYTLVEVYEGISPFSFFQYLFVPVVHNMTSEEKNLMIRHEHTHIKSWHSADRLFVELLRCLFWFSPLVWLYKQAIKDVHEFEADAHVIRQSDVIPYGELLLKYASRPTEPYARLSNPFFGTQLKRRFIMMTRATDNQRSLFKYLFVIPVLLMLIFTLSIKDNLVKAESIDPEYTIYNPESMDESINDFIFPEEHGVRADTVPPTKQDETVFMKVDVMPMFEGGERNLLDHLMEHIKYPVEAREAGAEGTVVVQFIVGKDGQIKDPQVVRSVHELLDQEALRVVGEMPAWTPGYQKGEPVAVKFTMPVRFRL
jgi:TonB family protein